MQMDIISMEMVIWVQEFTGQILEKYIIMMKMEKCLRELDGIQTNMIHGIIFIQMAQWLLVREQLEERNIGSQAMETGLDKR